MKRVLVIGGGGLLGRELVARLDQRYIVRKMSRSPCPADDSDGWYRPT
jgi:nucleoside-diphosphate-sugar epimerase